MKASTMFVIAAVYMGLIGIGHVVAPIALSGGVFPADSSSIVVAFLRHYSAMFLGLAVMNWLARNAEVSQGRTALIIGNIVLFGLAVVLDLITVFSGAGAFGLVPATMNLLIALGFVWVYRKQAVAS